ncbi:MAG: tRNA pseudouridine(38-40) synthase TruA [Treponema sp.]|jgi:tRNA pseudouridine38-40 synthase|nr:tRNA pseudouridine(38-40) synthase TruA [Treponema sp.]
MRTIKLLIAYDGTDFCGWQRQAGQRTVQAVIETALEQMHRHPVTLTGAGRTDSGVHAAGQAAGFRTDIETIKPNRFVPALNGLLSPDVRILESCEVQPDFHARFDARKRTYRYYFICGRQALPHESRYALQLWHSPRIELLNAYCRLLLGERDCSIFAASERSGASGKSGSDDTGKSRSRYISHAAFFTDGSRLVFEISANAFLWKMVRSIAGTFLHYEERDTPPELLRDIIASGSRDCAGPTLPPQGLFLWKVDYGVPLCVRAE